MRRLLTILILLIASHCSAAVFDYVQSKGTFITASGGTASFDSNTTAGNTLVLWSGDNSGSGTVPTVGGTGGITWTHVKSEGFSQCWVATSVPGGAVTISLTNASSQWDVMLSEWSGALVVDQSVSANVASTTPASGNTSATTAANELILGMTSKNTGGTLVAGSGFTARSTPSSGYAYFGLESKTVSATGVQQADFTTDTSGTCLIMCITLKESVTAPVINPLNRSIPGNALDPLRGLSLLDPRRWIVPDTYFWIAP